MTTSIEQPGNRPWPDHTQRLQVGDLRIDLRYRRVDRPDGHTELPHRVFDLLQLLLAQPHVLHSRGELFRRVWAGVIVEDANLSQSIWMLRKALGPERKHWIRTVAKCGYVFEPSAPVQVADTRPAWGAGADIAPPLAHPAGVSSAAATNAKMPMPAAQHPLAPPQWSWQRLLVRMAAATAVGVALVAGLTGLLPREATPAPPPPAPLAVALIPVGDSAAAADMHWPAKLLQAWLGWKLTHLPEVTVLSEAQLAADASAVAPRIILLASGRSADDPDEIFVRARFGQGKDGHGIELRGRPAQAPALVDELSTRVLAQLLPARANAPWPELSLDAATARVYGETIDAINARDWPTAVTSARKVVERAPEFGLARLNLAVAQDKLGQSRAARAQMAAARTHLAPVPDDAVPLLDALEMSVDPRRSQQAADAYGALADAYPERTGLALEQARLLARSGMAEQALAILSRPVWERQPTGTRIARLLNLARVKLMLGDPESARTDAGKAGRHAQAAGSGWTLEHAQALMMMAQADQVLLGEAADLALFEQAAQQFDAAGSAINATLARFHAELARSPAGTSSPLLDTLLAEARAGGYRRIEIGLLRTVAFRHYIAGQHDEYRMRLEQALASADDSGNALLQNAVELDLLNEDVLLGDFGSARSRIDRLRNAGLQGVEATWVDQFDAYLLQLHGRTDAALAALRRSARRADRDGAAALPPLSVARLACARAELMLQRGRLSRARSELSRCAESGQADLRAIAELGSAGADLLAGDRASTRVRLHEAQAALQDGGDGPDRWWQSLAMGYLWTRVGDPARADRLNRHVLPRAEAAGYQWLAAQAHAGLAETAAARGDWPASERHAAAARSRTPADAWMLNNRLDQVAVVSALAHGQTGRAASLLAELDVRAHDIGDIVVQMEVHSLMSPATEFAGCDRSARSSLLASTGLRGANLEWLVPALKTVDGEALARQGVEAL